MLLWPLWLFLVAPWTRSRRCRSVKVLTPLRRVFDDSFFVEVRRISATRDSNKRSRTSYAHRSRNNFHVSPTTARHLSEK
uniref:Putative secreted protein n=1 Tax=Ixodes ricinus TaxID=34613 RepID=A0A6B0U623_IXORI